MKDINSGLVGDRHIASVDYSLEEIERVAQQLLTERTARVDPVAAVLRSRGVPIVFATGYGQSAVDRSTGAPILPKPYTQEELAGALNEALCNHRANAPVGTRA